MPGSASFLPTNILKSEDVLFVQVFDPEANSDALLAEQVIVRLTTPGLDQETIQVTETAVDTGIFVGYIQTNRDPASTANCALEVAVGSTVSVTYVEGGVDVVSGTVLVDPFGRVFDSATGTPINGATLTLLDASTNLPADVFADDGVSSFPATLVSGDGTYTSDSGAYRYPYVVAGDYLLQVTPPNRFSFPSIVTDAQLQVLPGAPYALNAGSRGQTFTVPVGPAVQVDVPLDLLPLTPTASSLELLAVLPGGDPSVTTSVQPTACAAPGGFTTLPDPITLAQGILPIPANLALTGVDRLARGDALFLQVIDPDQDLDPFAPDFIVVEVLVDGQSELETLRLSETNDSTGIFVGYVQTSGNTTVAGNCQLEAGPGATVRVQYVDAADNTDTASAELAYDPGFTTFSSASGQLISGAVVTLIDEATGLPAVDATFSADGVTPFPNNLVVGEQVVDGAGTTISFAPGTFYFPIIIEGQYRFSVTAPPSFDFPSQIDDVSLSALSGGPFNLQSGSRGEVFEVVAGIPVGFDLPFDPISAEVFISKQASKQTAAIGDFVQYQIQIENADLSGTVSDLVLSDQLPIGFRYVSGSLSVDGANDMLPGISADGELMTLALGTLPPSSSITLKYVVEITAGAKLGPARNSATVSGLGVGRANVAFADVDVQEDLLQSKAILVGQVVATGCDITDAQSKDVQGMPDVRVWLEDGTFVVTDAEGKYHIEGIEAGSHVVAVDAATVPDSHELVLCEDNTRFAGDPGSQFIDVQGGTLWRADFYVAPKPDQVSEIVSRLDARGVDGKVQYTYWLKGGAVPLQNLRTTIMLGEQLAFVEGSARLNGQPIGDPTGLGMGAPTFKSPDPDDHFNYALTFETFVKSPERSDNFKSGIAICHHLRTAPK